MKKVDTIAAKYLLFIPNFIYIQILIVIDNFCLKCFY